MSFSQPKRTSARITDMRPDSRSVPTNEKSFTTISTTPAEVYDALRSLKPNKAGGLDGLTPKLLRLCSTGIAGCYQPYSTEADGCFPSEWKDALIVPVFKKGDRHNPGNSRPISLLSIISKTMERIVYNKLSKFISPFLSQDNLFLKRKKAPRCSCSALHKNDLRR